MALLVKSRGVTPVSWPNSLHSMTLLSSPPVAGVWWVHTLDWLYDSLFSLHLWLVCGECIHLIDSMTLSSLHLWLVCGDCIHLIDSMTLSSSPPVAGVWVSAYTWLTLWLSLLSTCSWCVVSAHLIDSMTLSLLSTCSWCVVSPPAPLSCGWRRIIQVDAAHWWWLRRYPPTWL